MRMKQNQIETIDSAGSSAFSPVQRSGCEGYYTVTGLRTLLGPGPYLRGGSVVVAVGDRPYYRGRDIGRAARITSGDRVTGYGEMAGKCGFVAITSCEDTELGLGRLSNSRRTAASERRAHV